MTSFWKHDEQSAILLALTHDRWKCIACLSVQTDQSVRLLILLPTVLWVCLLQYCNGAGTVTCQHCGGFKLKQPRTAAGALHLAGGLVKQCSASLEVVLQWQTANT